MTAYFNFVLAIFFIVGSMRLANTQALSPATFTADVYVVINTELTTYRLNHDVV